MCFIRIDVIAKHASWTIWCTSRNAPNINVQVQQLRCCSLVISFFPPSISHVPVKCFIIFLCPFFSMMLFCFPLRISATNLPCFFTWVTNTVLPTSATSAGHATSHSHRASSWRSTCSCTQTYVDIDVSTAIKHLSNCRMFSNTKEFTQVCSLVNRCNFLTIRVHITPNYFSGIPSPFFINWINNVF